MYQGTRFRTKLAVCILAMAVGVLPATAGFSQGVPASPYPTQGYPAPTYPTQADPAQGQAYPAYPTQAAAPPRAHPIRDLFAGTIAAILQTASGGLLNALTGSIQNWFARKQGAYAGAGYGGAGGYPYQPAAGGYSGANGYAGAGPNGGAVPGYPESASQYPGAGYAPSTYPTPQASYPGTAAYPQPGTNPATGAQAYGSQPGTYGQSSAYGQASGYAPSQVATYDTRSAQVYDARTGQPATVGTNPYAVPASGYDGTLYAGIAYEVHALSADGQSTPINPATYVFRTGDKFAVYFRPSLPGRMEIYNVNPAGQQTLIDTTNMAAGQMTTLGPYIFTNLTGDESLRLVLSPCSSPQLLAATRDIVRADSVYQAAPQPSPTAAGGGQLSMCSAMATRGLGVRTRDIEKVAVEGTTSFALDPVSPRELSSGQVTAREVTIVFHHR